MKQPLKIDLKPKRMMNGVFHTTLIKKQSPYEDKKIHIF